MKLQVMEKHDGEGVFPLFVKGTVVGDLINTEESPHWCSCVINGHATYIPEIYVVDGVLVKDYNPTELVVKKEEVIFLIEIVFEWLYVKDENEKTGWLPASKVFSVLPDR